MKKSCSLRPPSTTKVMDVSSALFFSQYNSGNLRENFLEGNLLNFHYDSLK